MPGALFLLSGLQRLAIALLIGIHRSPGLSLRNRQRIAIRFLFPVFAFALAIIAGDDAGIVIGARAGIENAVGDNTPAARAVLTVEVVAVGGGVAAGRADMDLRLPLDALILQRAMIDARLMSGQFQGAIELARIPPANSAWSRSECPSRQAFAPKMPSVRLRS